MYERVNRYNYLEHHGILGMKWGVRRYQNEDGTLTDAGKRRYNVQTLKKELKEDNKTLGKLQKELINKTIKSNMNGSKALKKEINDLDNRGRKLYADIGVKRAELARNQKGEKAEEKAYKKEMYRRLENGYLMDDNSLSKDFGKAITKKKGKQYADKIMNESVDKLNKKVSRQKRAEAVQLVAAVGLATVSLASYGGYVLTRSY